MTELFCSGFGRLMHATEDDLAPVYFPGCPVCGGLACGDLGEMRNLCPECLENLQDSQDALRYSILDARDE